MNFRALCVSVFSALVMALPLASAQGQQWYDVLMQKGIAARAQSERFALPLPDMGQEDFTFTTWFKTEQPGVILSVSGAGAKGHGFGKLLYVPKGKLQLEVCSVGILRGKVRVLDGKWHHVAVVGGQGIFSMYLDGVLEDKKNCRKTVGDRGGWVFKFGGFPHAKGTYEGLLDDACFFGRQLKAAEIARLAASKTAPAIEGLLAHWPMDGKVGDRLSGRRTVTTIGKIEHPPGRNAQAAQFTRGDLIEFKALSLRKSHPDNIAFDAVLASASEADKAQMRQERNFGIWRPGWSSISPGKMALRYAWAFETQMKSDHPAAHVKALDDIVAKAKSQDDLARVRTLYSRLVQRELLLQAARAERLDALQKAIDRMASAPETKTLATAYQSGFDTIRAKKDRWLSLGIDKSLETSFDIAPWRAELAALRRKMMLMDNPLRNFDKILFAKRSTFTSSHFYTDHIDGARRLGGNLSILDLKSGKVTDLLGEMSRGTFGRFDLSFDATKVVFDWKGGPDKGFRIYEVSIDGTGLRQLTFDPKDEKARVKKYDRNPGRRGAYHHQTDDMHPCYLPGGGIIFTSSRCEYGKHRDGCCKSLILLALVTKSLVINDVVSSHVISCVVRDSHLLSALLTHCVNHFQAVVAISPHMEKTHGEKEDRS